MRKMKMFGLALAAVALVSMTTAGQWKSEASETAAIISDWLVKEMDSIRDSKTARFVASWAVKGRDALRESYAAQVVAGWVVSGTDALQEVLTSPHLRTPARPWTDASTSHQGLQTLVQESRPAESIPPAQAETVAEVRVEQASAAPIATPEREGAWLDEASTPPAVASVPEEIGREEASAPAAPLAITRRDLGSDEPAAYMALARSKSPQGDIAAAEPLSAKARVEVPATPVVTPVSDVRSVEAPAATAAPSTPAPRGPAPPDVAAYIARARAKIQQGDIAAARRLLERASDSGEAEAWFALAETYDPQMLARWGVLGVKSDLEKARTLYQKAEARGARGARERLLALRK